MKANELMLGDYVSTPKGIFRVTAIQDNDVIFTDYADDIEGAVDIEDVQPIPMTAAILTKSGFTNCTTTKIDLEMGHEYWYPGEDGFVANESILITLFAAGRFQVRMGNSVICGLEYVHELQHAFRLCNIEYEIKL